MNLNVKAKNKYLKGCQLLDECLKASKIEYLMSYDDPEIEMDFHGAIVKCFELDFEGKPFKDFAKALECFDSFSAISTTDEEITLVCQSSIYED